MIAIQAEARASSARDVNLAAFAGFAGVLAAAGLPIYIHAPKFYVDEYGVSLAALGGVLVGLRLLDVVQDPALGWLAGRIRNRAAGAAIGVALLAASMVGLFAAAPPIPPLAWFALTLTGLFSAFSWLTILFYSQGVRTAETLGSGGHVRIAAWRETGALSGVCLAAVAPTALAATGSEFTYFAAAFALAAVLAAVAMRGEWRGAGQPNATPFRPALHDPTARRLLLIALLNAAPVAVTSTLFLFFVESRLAAPGWEGPLLLAFFVAAAASASAWGRAAQRFGARPVLLAAMVLAIVSFAWAATLGAGDLVAFAIICLASGAALGADLTLLPALFSARLAALGVDASGAFGLWAFVSKITLAVAAATVLPALDAAGFDGPDSPARALFLLTMLYAVLPCILKVAAIALLATTRIEEA